ncbi:inner membrane protein [Gammaproteobacteria bacterium]
MLPGSHLLSSWLLANYFIRTQRERRIVTLIGLSPDVDGAGLIIDQANSLMGASSYYFYQYHHVLAHSLLASIIFSGIAAFLASTNKLFVFYLALIVTHLHFFCDLIGSRGPDGYQWPIYYLAPFNLDFQLVWSGQWTIDAWQNIVILYIMFVIIIVQAWKQRYSFVQVISVWLDNEFFKIMNRYR